MILVEVEMVVMVLMVTVMMGMRGVVLAMTVKGGRLVCCW